MRVPNEMYLVNMHGAILPRELQNSPLPPLPQREFLRAAGMLLWGGQAMQRRWNDGAHLAGNRHEGRRWAWLSPPSDETTIAESPHPSPSSPVPLPSSPSMLSLPFLFAPPPPILYPPPLANAPKHHSLKRSSPRRGRRGESTQHDRNPA